MAFQAQSLCISTTLSPGFSGYPLLGEVEQLLLDWPPTNPPQPLLPASVQGQAAWKFSNRSGRLPLQISQHGLLSP